MAKQLKTMSGYDSRNQWVFSFWRNVVSDGADWTSTGRLFQSRGPAAANERSPTVTSRDGRTSRRRTVGCHSDVTSLLRSLNYQDKKNKSPCKMLLLQCWIRLWSMQVLYGNDDDNDFHVKNFL